MKMIFVEWFSDSKGSFGIVVGEDHVTRKRKAYIGACQQGGTEESDAKYIMEYGAKFLPQHAQKLDRALNS